MKTDLSREQVSAYQKNGFVVIPDFLSPDELATWRLAVEDTALENDCLYFIPGSHKTATYDSVDIGQNTGDPFRAYRHWGQQKAIAAPMNAGSCSFHNGLAAYGARPNMTPGYRRAITCAYLPDGSTFHGQQNVLSDEQISRLKPGDVLEDENQNPLLYHVSKSFVPSGTLMA